MWFASLAARITAVVLILALYLTVVWMGLTEEGRRSLAIRGATPPTDYVTINLRVTSVDTAQGCCMGVFVLFQRVDLPKTRRRQPAT
jgi:hypothetical protein